MLGRWVVQSITWAGTLTRSWPVHLLHVERPLTDDDVTDLIRRWKEQQASGPRVLP